MENYSVNYELTVGSSSVLRSFQSLNKGATELLGKFDKLQKRIGNLSKQINSFNNKKMVLDIQVNAANFDRANNALKKISTAKSKTVTVDVVTNYKTMGIAPNMQKGAMAAFGMIPNTPRSGVLGGLLPGNNLLKNQAAAIKSIQQKGQRIAKENDKRLAQQFKSEQWRYSESIRAFGNASIDDPYNNPRYAKLIGNDTARRDAYRIKNARLRQSNTIKQASRIGELGRSIQTSGMSFGAGTLMNMGISFAPMLIAGAIGAGIGAVWSEALEYQTKIDLSKNILKSSDKDISTFDERFNSMALNMRRIGAETKFTAAEVADATRFLAMAGMSVSQIDKSMKPIANLAMIGNTDIGAMADVVTNIMTGYNLDMEKSIVNVSDILTSVSSGSNATVMQMAESFKFSGSVMANTHQDFAQTAAIIGALGDAGEHGSIAGTHLRSMMLRLIKPSKEGSKVLNDWGVSISKIGADGKKQMRPMIDIMADLADKTKDMDDQTRTASIFSIFGRVPTNAALSIMSRIPKIQELIGNSVMSAGLAEEHAQVMQNNIPGLAKQISSQFTENGMTIFEAYEPKIKSIMQSILGWLKSEDSVKFFNNIIDGITGVIGSFKLFSGFLWKFKDLWADLFVVGINTTIFSNILGKVMSFGSTVLKIIADFKVLGTIGSIFSKGGLSMLFTGGGLAALTGVGTLIAGIGTAAYGLYKLRDIRFNQSVERAKEDMESLTSNLSSVDGKVFNVTINTKNIITEEKQESVASKVDRLLAGTKEKRMIRTPDGADGRTGTTTALGVDFKHLKNEFPSFYEAMMSMESEGELKFKEYIKDTKTNVMKPFVLKSDFGDIATKVYERMSGDKIVGDLMANKIKEIDFSPETYSSIGSDLYSIFPDQSHLIKSYHEKIWNDKIGILKTLESEDGLRAYIEKHYGEAGKSFQDFSGNPSLTNFETIREFLKTNGVSPLSSGGFEILGEDGKALQGIEAKNRHDAVSRLLNHLRVSFDGIGFSKKWSMSQFQKNIGLPYSVFAGTYNAKHEETDWNGTGALKDAFGQEADQAEQLNQASSISGSDGVTDSSNKNKNIVFKIENLMNIETASLMKEGGVESLKADIITALMGAVNDANAMLQAQQV